MSLILRVLIWFLSKLIVSFTFICFYVCLLGKHYAVTFTSSPISLFLQNSSREILVRSFQLAFSLRNFSLAHGGKLELIKSCATKIEICIHLFYIICICVFFQFQILILFSTAQHERIFKCYFSRILENLSRIHFLVYE